MKINNVLLIAVLAWCGMAGQMSGAERRPRFSQFLTIEDLSEEVEKHEDANFWFEDLSWHGQTPLIFAALKDWTGILSTLLRYYSANINAQSKPDSETALMYAIRAKSWSAADLLLAKGADITLVNNNGTTTLMFAARSGRESIVKLLLAKGADITLVNNNGTTTLMFAAESGSESIVKLLLENGAKGTINHVDSSGKTALMYAARSGSESIVTLLLENGAKGTINHVDSSGKTALIYAAGSRNVSLVKLLLENGAKDTINHVDRRGETALIYAAGSRNVSLVKLLLENGARGTINHFGFFGETALMRAADTGNEPIIKLLLENDAKDTINAVGGPRLQTALTYAAESGVLSAVATLLDFGANPNIINLFQIANRAKDPAHVEEVKSIIKEILSRNSITLETLKDGLRSSPDSIRALFKEKLEQKLAQLTLQDLLEAEDIEAAILKVGPNIVLQVVARSTLLSDKPGTVAQRAIDLGANVRAKDSAGETPLVIATKAGNLVIVRQLLSSKRVSTEDIRTALRFAKDGSEIQKLLKPQYSIQITQLLETAAHGSPDAVERYLAEGIAIDETNELGETALMWAAANGNAPVVESLLRRGANINAETTHKETALTAAVKYDHQTIVTLLLGDWRIKTDDIKRALSFTEPDSEIQRLLQKKLDALQLAER